MNYSGIRYCDIANGTGVRISLFVSGCPHHCKNCFNEHTWDRNYGEPFTKDIEDEIIKKLGQSYISGLTILGGEPMVEYNQPDVARLVKRVKDTYINKNIWIYTGYVWEHIPYLPDSTIEIIRNIEVMVDGPFIEDLHNVNLNYRGSSNQRIIDVKKTLSMDNGKVYEFEELK